MRVVVEFRFVISLALSGVVGVSGLNIWPFPHENPILGLIAVSRPVVYASFCYAYATVWFSTPFFLFNIVFSLAYIFIARPDRQTRSAPLPPYPASASRADLFLVLGEQHHHASPLPAPQPRWLAIPERGLYTGMLIVGAVGTGKTSACMYPYVEQLVGYRANDSARKIGGLILRCRATSVGTSVISWRDTGEPTTMSKSASRRHTATTRCTTSSMRTRWPTGSPR
jgi:hypothetical protein